MIQIRQRVLFTYVILPFLLSGFTHTLSAQNDSLKPKINRFGGAVTLQSKGISTIPNLTLGKPAMTFDMVMGRKLTFEPQFRFSLKGEPWAIVFWWRYKILTDNKFTMDARVNYSFSFKTISGEIGGTSQEYLRATSYLAGALSPNYQFNKYLGIGMYLFMNHGIEKFITQYTYMLSLRPGISNIPLAKSFVARFGPEVYYLKMDENDGVFLNATLSISKKNFPFSLSALLNKPLNSNIPSEYDLLWNVGLTYTFNKTYIQAVNGKR